MTNEQSSQNGEGYQIDEIMYAKGKITLNAYMYAWGSKNCSTVRTY